MYLFSQNYRPPQIKNNQKRRKTWRIVISILEMPIKCKTPDYSPGSGASQMPSCIKKLQQPHECNQFKPYSILWTIQEELWRLPKPPKGIELFAQNKRSYLLVINNNFDLKVASRHLLQLQGLLLTFLNVNDVLVSLRFNVKSPASAVTVPTFCPSSDAWMTSYFLGVILK